mmetsp:Transcript_29487/g.44776  ORF Transcript_29487/g.44776 Transcript_29487/m.44776 type:complete len:133 (-) Transcript_29487:4320-4718(-)
MTLELKSARAEARAFESKVATLEADLHEKTLQLKELLKGKEDHAKEVSKHVKAEKELKLKNEDLEAQLEETITMLVEMQATTIEQKQDLMQRDAILKMKDVDLKKLEDENLDLKKQLQQAVGDLNEAAVELE